MIETITATRMPAWMLSATTAAAAITATANSCRRTRSTRRMPRMSTSSAPIRNTTAARAGIGR